MRTLRVKTVQTYTYAKDFEITEEEIENAKRYLDENRGYNNWDNDDLYHYLLHTKVEFLADICIDSNIIMSQGGDTSMKLIDNKDL